jgi:Holliday junction resolvase-like predicted endonuclease
MKMAEDIIYIQKYSGEKEPFSAGKLKVSLTRAGAAPDLAEKVIGHIKEELHDGMTTAEIYAHAFDFLHKASPHLAARFQLKKAVMELGPDGHPFEKFVSEIMKSMGYEVAINQMVPGRCVTHEVDVIGKKDGRHVMVECKFHNQPGVDTDVKVALYVQARFEDIARHWETDPKDHDKLHEAWLITNTKLTSDAIRYGKCVGMKMIGWSYPREGSLERVIEDPGLHPITSLTMLDIETKRKLLDKRVVLCRELVEDPSLLHSVGVSEAAAQAVIEEAKALSEKK